MAIVPLVLYLIGAVFLALTVLFVLEAKVVCPANRRDALLLRGRAPVQRPATARVRPVRRGMGGVAALD